MSETSTDPRQHMNYWRSLQELADTEEYRNQVANEFPSGIEPAADAFSQSEEARVDPRPVRKRHGPERQRHRW